MNTKHYIAIVGADGKEYAFLHRFCMKPQLHPSGDVDLDSHHIKIDNKWRFSTNPHKDNIFTYPTAQKAKETIERSMKKNLAYTAQDITRIFSYRFKYNNPQKPVNLDNYPHYITHFLQKVVVRSIEAIPFIFVNCNAKPVIQSFRSGKKDSCSQCGLVVTSTPNLKFGIGRICGHCLEKLIELSKPVIEAISEEDRKNYTRCRLLSKMQ